MARISLFACVYGVFLSAFLTPPADAEPVPFPSKIGILADAQITTDKGTYDYGMRSRMADRLSKVAIRTVAQEYFAPLMLERMLKELEKEKVDLILFLGDGANSGCKDELDTVFRILASSRERSGIPTYFVIGNHDYMGAGNQVNLEFRRQLCDKGDQNNPAQTKAQLIERLIAHNTASAKIDTRFAYSGQLTKADSPDICPGDDLGHRTMNYVASLSGKTDLTRPVQILLADTSDYRDVTFKANVGYKVCEGIGGWGLKGSMSFNMHDGKSSQIAMLLSMANPSGQYRIMASHYSPLHFNAIYPWGSSPSLVKDALGNLLSDGENVWLTAHTHTERPKVENYAVGKRFSGKHGNFIGINVGSTTDFNSHALVIAAKDNNNLGDNRMSLGYKLIEHPIIASACAKVLAAARVEEKGLTPVCGKQSYRSSLGLDKTYQEKCFGEAERDQVRKNIDQFSSKYSNDNSVDELEVKACLAYTASAFEKLGKLP
jgi:hypothetical protein